MTIVQKTVNKLIDLDEFAFPITTRVSNRAKRIHAYVKLHGIEVALPKFASLEDAFPLLKKHQHWFEQQWQLLQQNQQQKLVTSQSAQWPLCLSLPLISHSITIQLTIIDHLHYLDIHKQRFCLGKQYDKSVILYYIKLWFKDYSYQLLLPLLQKHSQTMSLNFQSFETKWLKSCWGSCSHHNRIQLNALLLFFDRDIIDYVIIHELAHIKHKNHSQQFWHLVKTYCPNYQSLKQMLNDQAKSLPLWLHDATFLPN